MTTPVVVCRSCGANLPQAERPRSFALDSQPRTFTIAAEARRTTRARSGDRR
jgi:hypothetical protein